MLTSLAIIVIGALLDKSSAASGLRGPLAQQVVGLRLFALSFYLLVVIQVCTSVGLLALSVDTAQFLLSPQSRAVIHSTGLLMLFAVEHAVVSLKASSIADLLCW